MANLEIRKKSLKTWLHIPSDADEFILSKFYCKTDDDIFKIVEESGSSRKEYTFDNITVYDDTAGGTIETFASSQALMIRLEALRYVGFNRDGDIPTLYVQTIVAGTNITIDDTDPLNPIVSSSGGGSGAGTLQEVTDLGATTDVAITVQGVTISGDLANEVTNVGNEAGLNNTGGYVTNLGSYAGANNTGDIVTNLGIYAGFENTGSDVTNLGSYAGGNNAGSQVINLGQEAGYNNTGDEVTNIGQDAGYNNTGDEVTNLGSYAGLNNAGSQVTNLGQSAGYNNTGSQVINLGQEAGYSNILNNVINLGRNSQATATNQLALNTGIANSVINLPATTTELTLRASASVESIAYLSDVSGDATLGLIKIVDIAGDFFTNLATASAYIRTFTSATITNESFSNGTFWFTVPNGSSFALSTFFLGHNLVGKSAYIEDTLGLITTFGNLAFKFNSGNNILGNCTFGVDAFQTSTGNNIFGNCTFGQYSFYPCSGNNVFGNCTFGQLSFQNSSGISRINNILLSNTSNFFANGSTGRFEINGTIGTTTGNDYANFFPGSTAVIWAKKIMQTNNAGGIEGDLARAQTNGAKLFFGYADIPTKTSDLINDGDNGTSHFISLEDLPSNLVLYPTSVASDIGGYSKIVTSITDPSYDATAVDITTGAISGSNQLIASLSTSANIIIGNPGLFNVSTIGNIRRTAGGGTAEFYFEVYKRTSGGTETLITTSSNTSAITSTIYSQFSNTALWNDGVFLATDRIVLKFYGTKVGGGSNPTYDFQFGGGNPVRTTVPIPLNVVPNINLNDINDVDIATPLNNQGLIYETSSLLWKNKTIDKTLVGLANVDNTSDLNKPVSTATATELGTKQTWLVKDSTPTTALTGTTVLTQIGASILIPANTFSANDAMILESFGVSKTGTAGTFVWQLSHNTSNTIVGSSVICTAQLSAANLSGNMQRVFEINAGLLKNRLRGTTPGATDKIATNATGLSIPFNPTINNYFFRVGTLLNATDSVVSTQILILK